jgi:hypothetical protein
MDIWTWDNMWIDKDDMFVDDKVQEFKQSNPNKKTHIRTLCYIDPPYPSTCSLSHLLYQHTKQHMSSTGSNVLANKYTAGVYDDSTARDKHLDDI